MRQSKKLVIDIETNAIDNWNTLNNLEVVHCLCVQDLDTEEVWRYNDIYDSDSLPLCDGLQQLKEADLLIAHNGIGFDFPALFKQFGFKHPNIQDTMIMSRCIFPDLKTEDYRNGVEPKLCGSHSLKAWGYRLRENKGDFGEDTDWSTWSKEMEDYCVQDVKVTSKLYKHLMSQEPAESMLTLEHEFAKIIRKQEYNGFPFDVAKATELHKELTIARSELLDELQLVFPPKIEQTKTHWWTNGTGDKFPTKRSMIEIGYKPNECFKGELKTKEIPFNPNSRDQICERLMEQGWKPQAFEGKRPAINEAVLKEINTEPSLKLLKFLLISKRLGQLAEGNQAWLKLQRDGVIYGSVNTNGTISGRCSHAYPNVAQVPAVRAEYGAQCRELFKAPEGSVLVGVDASGLELRCLAHMLYPWDKGKYAKEILEGDIHTSNQHAMGLTTRDQAKTAIYCLIYGGGFGKLGSIVGGTFQDGRKLKEKFESEVPAYKELCTAVSDALKLRPYLIGLDGRQLPARSDHSALNLLLQSAGAVIMKQALVEFTSSATKRYTLHANVHDEIQFSCSAEDADELGKCAVNAIKNAGNFLKFNCPLDGEYRVGANWKETH